MRTPFLSAYQHLLAKWLAEARGVLVGLPFSTSTVTSVLARAYEGLGDFEKQVTKLLVAVSVAHADGSGVRVVGGGGAVLAACDVYVSGHLLWRRSLSVAGRLRDCAGECQRFLVDFRVPFDNNLG